MKRRTLLQAGLAGLTSASWLGLNGCSNSADHLDPKVIRAGVTTRVQMLDPRKATDALSSRINRLMYRQLIDFDAAFKPVPDLATWETISPIHCRFSLQSLPLFHHGKPLSATDVAATYLSVLDPAFGSAHYGSLNNISHIDVVDERTLDFYLHKPDALFVGRLVMGILPADLIAAGHLFQQQPIGCGACQFVSMNEQKLVLKRRKDEVLLEFIPVKDATTRVLKLQKGELDWVQNDLSPELVQYCQRQANLTVQWQVGTSFGYLGFNFEDPLLAQLPLRQALALGIDRQAIVNALFDGHARLAGGLLVPEHWSGAPSLRGFAYDPERAKALLKQVVIPPGLVKLNQKNQPFIELSYKTSNDPTRIRLATIYQSQLKKIGIHLNIQSYDWGTFYNDIKQGRFQLFSLAWVGIKSPDIFQYAFDSNAIPPLGANRGRYRDAVTDQLILQATQTQDLSEQAALYQQLQARLQDNLAHLPLWFEDQYCVTRHGVTGYTVYSDGRMDGLLQVQKQPAPVKSSA